LLEKRFPGGDSPYTREGTLAHRLCELYCRKDILGEPPGPIDDAISECAADPMHSGEMGERAMEYRDFVRGALEDEREADPSAILLLERRVGLGAFVPGGFGSSDAIIAGGRSIHVIDFKYGKGVLVKAERNSQLMLYAAGALHELGCLYDPPTARVTVYQPRLGNIDSWELPSAELMEWARGVVKPAAELAAKGAGECRAGEWCASHFCKALPACAAYSERMLELSRLGMLEAELLSDEDIALTLTRSAELSKWAKAVEEYALTEALRGRKWPGFKLVEGRSARKYKSDGEIWEALQSEGYERGKVFAEKLIGLEAMESLLGKKAFARLLAEPGLVVKPPGKPALVPESDKRPELAPPLGAAAAARAFAGEPLQD
jgi:hypothetical protein